MPIKILGEKKMGETLIADVNDISELIQRTLNCVDHRLVDHGKRVAYLVSNMLRLQDSYSQKERQDICILAMLHDIGAYKTEEIERITQFEAEDVWEHSVYGYLFLYYLSPLKELSRSVLFHHVRADMLKDVPADIKRIAQMIHLADRIDMFWRNGLNKEKLGDYLKKVRDLEFTAEVIDLYIEADSRFRLYDNLVKTPDFNEILPDMIYSQTELDSYLKMLIFAIDFRSQHTVTHTITTARIGCSAAERMGCSKEGVQKIYYGALLHDLGKIGIPVEILEFPGKLSPQAMSIMRTHVDLTEKILGDAVDSDITKIALRHHEKLDGSGYPKGLNEKDLTLEEQILAVADIVSALLGTRSYKEAYSKERTLRIIEQQAENKKLNKDVVAVIRDDFDEILREVSEQCTPILETYHGIQAEYQRLLAKYYTMN